MPSIETIPPEILSEIFRWALPNDDHSSPGCQSPRTSAEMPYPVSATCARWRTVALRSSWLWSSIHVEIDKDGHIRPPVPAISLWLERSRNQPLVLGLNADWKDCPPSLTSAINNVLELFTAHMNRWKCIHLYLPDCRLPDASHFPQRGEAPLLTHVDTNVGNTEDMVTSLAPILSSVQQLYLLCDHILACEAIECLALCTELTALELHSVQALPEGYLELVKHPSLRSLALREVREDPTPFFDSLVLPSLESLKIECQDAYLGFSAHLDRFVRHTRLQNLVLCHTNISSKTLLQLLEATPLLIDLRIPENSIACVDNRALTRLTTVIDRPPLCPRLVSLSLGTGVIEARDGLLGQMVQSRRPLTHPDGQHNIPEQPLLRRLELGDGEWLDLHPVDSCIFDWMVIGGLELRLDDVEVGPKHPMYIEY